MTQKERIGEVISKKKYEYLIIAATMITVIKLGVQAAYNARSIAQDSLKINRW